MMLRIKPRRKKSKNSSMSARIAATKMPYWRFVIGVSSICSKVDTLLMVFSFLAFRAKSRESLLPDRGGSGAAQPAFYGVGDLSLAIFKHLHGLCSAEAVVPDGAYRTPFSVTTSVGMVTSSVFIALSPG
jgi:hypothetical protein